LVSGGRVGDWGQHAFDFRSQSLYAVAHRYLTPIDAQVMAKGGDPIFVNVLDLRPEQAGAVVLGLFGVLAVAFVAACGLRRRSASVALAGEYSMAAVLLVLTSALSWTYSFVMLLLPVTFGICLLDRRERLPPQAARLLRAGLWGVGVATVLLVSDYARALGNLCWSAVLLLAALMVACRHLRHRSAEVGEDTASS
jgi:hypothetical protein